MKEPLNPAKIFSSSLFSVLTVKYCYGRSNLSVLKLLMVLILNDYLYLKFYNVCL